MLPVVNLVLQCPGIALYPQSCSGQVLYRTVLARSAKGQENPEAGASQLE